MTEDATEGVHSRSQSLLASKLAEKAHAIRVEEAEIARINALRTASLDPEVIPSAV